MSSAREVYDQLKGMKATHTLWTRHSSDGNDAPAGDLMFFNYAERYTRITKTYGPFTLAEMDTRPPAPSRPDPEVAYFGCAKGYAQGLYPLKDLGISPYDPRPKSDYPRPSLPRAGQEEAIVGRATYAVSDDSCGAPVNRALLTPFTLLASHGKTSFYVRTTEP
jgi:hypothetical protein